MTIIQLNQGFWEGGSIPWLSSLVLLSCGLIVCVVSSAKWRATKRDRFPAGPWPLPIIGHLHLLLRHVPHQTLAKLSRKYGDLMGLRFGQQRCVVVSSPELAKEFLSTHDMIFANRPPLKVASLVFYGPHIDLFFANYGTAWRKHRRICIQELFTAKRLQDLQYVRQEEVAALLQNIAHLSHGGMTAINIAPCVAQMSANIISRVICSRRISPSEAEKEDLPQLFKEVELEITPTLGDFIPWLACFDVARMRRMSRIHGRVDRMITCMLTERKQAMLQKTAPQDDLLHALLQANMKSSACEEDVLTMTEIKSIIMDMVGGSIHTTALTLEWAMAELLKNPHCLKGEIGRVLGEKQHINDLDVSKLTYLKSVVKEVLRLHPTAPLLIPHISSAECKVRNYHLPKNTQLLLNVWAIARDELLWPNATQFLPERFEGKDIDVKGHHFELLPFGGGRRACIGLPLGLSIVEVTPANLVNKFDWELPAGETSVTVNMDESIGILLKKAAPTIACPKLRK